MASSSNDNAVVEGPARVGGCDDPGNRLPLSPTATTTPVLDVRVCRVPLKPEDRFVNPSLLEDEVVKTAWETAGRSPPSTAGLGLLVRCQSW